MNRKGRHWVLAYLGLLLSATAVVAQAPSEFARDVDVLFNRQISEGGPGCAVAAYHEGAIVLENHYGIANLDYDIPITDETVFYVGSVSKQFAAATVAMAAHRGYLSLDDDLREYIPELPEFPETVTPLHLIHHTSGIIDLYTLMDVAGLKIENLFSDEEALDLIIGQQELEFLPGEEFLYSNGGYFLQAVLIERATGLSMRKFAERYLFEPLGMHDTRFHDTWWEVIPNRAMSYRKVDGEWRIAYLQNFERVGPGGLYTTAADMLLWDENFYSAAVGGPEFVQQLHEVGILNDGSVTDYAFGLRLVDHNGLPTVGHSGGFHGFRAHFVRFPEQHFSVLVACNFEHAEPSLLATQVAELFLHEEMAPELERFEGSYEAELGARYHIEMKGGALHLTRDGRDRSPVRLRRAGYEPASFRVPGWWRTGMANLTFSEQSAEVTGFVLDMGRGSVEFIRVSRGN